MHPQPGRPWILPVAIGIGGVALILLLIACVIGPGQRRGVADVQGVSTESFLAALKRVHQGQSVITLTGPEQVDQLIQDEIARDNIRFVSFSTSDLTDDRFARVKALPQLETLVFDHCRNAAGVLNAVRTVGSLRQLSFDSTRLDGDDLRALVQLNQLERIQFHNMMSFDEIEQLRALMPEVEIEWIRE